MISVVFSSKCLLFHNSNVFGSCIIHILYTGCAKIKKNNSGAKRLTNWLTSLFHPLLLYRYTLIRCSIYSMFRWTYKSKSSGFKLGDLKVHEAALHLPIPLPPIDLPFVPDIFHYNMWNSTCHALLCLFADMFSTEQRLASHEITATSLCILNNSNTYNKTGNERVM